MSNIFCNFAIGKENGYEFTKYNNEGGKTVLDMEDDAAPGSRHFRSPDIISIPGLLFLCSVT